MVAHCAAKLRSAGRNKRVLLMRSNCIEDDGAVQVTSHRLHLLSRAKDAGTNKTNSLKEHAP